MPTLRGFSELATAHAALKPKAIRAADLMAGARKVIRAGKFGSLEPKLIRFLPEHLRVRKNREIPAGLRRSVTDMGQLRPGIVRNAPLDRKGTKYEVLAGEKRLTILRDSGERFRALLIDCPDDELLSYIIAFVDNLHATDLSIPEKVSDVTLMHEKFGMSQEAIATVLGHDKEHISALYNLRRLIKPVMKALGEGRITFDLALVLSRAKDESQERWMKDAVRGRMRASELSDRMNETGDKRHNPLAKPGNPSAWTKAANTAEGLRRKAVELRKLLEGIPLPTSPPKGHPVHAVVENLDATGKEIEVIIKRLPPKTKK